MDQFVMVALGFPTIIFSILLTVALIFWLITMTGALDHGLDTHVDADADGAFDLGGILSVLGIQGVPLSFLLSFWFLFAWILSFSAQNLWDAAFSGLSQTVFHLVVMVAAFLLGLVLAALALRPLVPLFIRQNAKAIEAQVLGQIGTIISGQADETQGRAEVMINGAHLIFQVRSSVPLARGARVLFTDYSPQTRCYHVTTLALEAP